MLSPPPAAHRKHGNIPLCFPSEHIGFWLPALESANLAESWSTWRANGPNSHRVRQNRSEIVHIRLAEVAAQLDRRCRTLFGIARELTNIAQHRQIGLHKIGQLRSPLGRIRRQDCPKLGQHWPNLHEIGGPKSARFCEIWPGSGSIRVGRG